MGFSFDLFSASDLNGDVLPYRDVFVGNRIFLHAELLKVRGETRILSFHFAMTPGMVVAISESMTWQSATDRVRVTR